MLLVVASGIVFLSTGCSPAASVTPPDNHEAEIKALTEVEQAWAKLSLSVRTQEELDKFLAYYADDAIVLFPNEPMMTGRTAINSGFKPFLSDPNFSVEFHSNKVDVAKSGDLGYTQGPYTMKTTDPVTKKVAIDKGNYITTWRKGSDGAWKVSVDATISELPVH